jgi:Uma2 family endonuclease
MNAEAPEPYLIRGNWHARPLPTHSPVLAAPAFALARHLDAWLPAQHESAFEVFSDGWFQLRSFPPSLIRLPLAVVRGKLPTLETNWVPSMPEVAVDVILGKDRHGDLTDRVRECLACGVQLVWVLEPRHRTVTVFRPGAEPELFNRTHTLSADPVLPGFSCPVADLFR